MDYDNISAHNTPASWCSMRIKSAWRPHLWLAAAHQLGPLVSMLMYSDAAEMSTHLHTIMHIHYPHQQPIGI